LTMHKQITLFFVIFLLSIILKAQCVKNISTNPENPVNNEFLTLYPGNINPFLNTFNWQYQYPVPTINLNLNAYWAQGFQNPIDPTVYPMIWPFSNALPGQFSYLYYNIPEEDRDMHWEDGWELLWMNTGYFPNGDPITNNPYGSPFFGITFPASPNNIPYFVLYNRYTGLIRLFANVWYETLNPYYQNLKVIFKYEDVYRGLNDISGLLRHVGKSDQPLDQKTKVASITSPRYHAPLTNHWIVSEFQLGYDPCICYSEGQMRFEFWSFDSLQVSGIIREIAVEKNITQKNYVEEDILNLEKLDLTNYKGGTLMYRTLDNMIAAYDAAMIKYNDDMEDYMSAKNNLGRQVMSLMKDVVVNGFANYVIPGSASLLNFIDDTKIGTNKVTIEMTLANTNLTVEEKKIKVGKDIMNAGKALSGKGYDFISTSLFGHMPDKPVKPMTPVATFSESAYKGEIIDVHPNFTQSLYVPGSIPFEIGGVSFSPATFPAYNEVPGLFALLSTPKVALFEDETNSETIFDPPAGGYGKELESHKKVVIKFNDPLKYKLNPALDYDTDITEIYVAFKVFLKGNLNTTWMSGNVGNNPPPDITRETDEVFSNMDMQHHIKKDGSERITLFSKYIPIKDAGKELYAFDIISKVLSDYTINQGDLIFDIDPTELNLTIEKIEMKVLADYYFEQTAWNGEQVNTFQVFTYQIYEQGGVDFIDEYVTSENEIVLFNPGTIELTSNTYGPNSPEVIYYNADSLFIRSRDVVIKGDIQVQSSYSLYIQAVNSIKQIPPSPSASTISPNVSMEIKDILGFGTMPMMTDEEVTTYCTSTEGEYKAREYQARPGEKFEEIPEAPEIPEKTKQLNFYTSPNPANNMFRAKMDEVELRQYTFQLINISGRVMINESVSGANDPVFEIDVSALPSGLYILVVTDELGNVARKNISIIK
jgi:type IX secretion system substrate protein